MLRDESGNITIIVTFVLVILVVALAFVMDFGVIYAEKAKLIKAMDAAILAGGQALPGDIGQARATMESYLEDNGVDVDQVNIWISDDGMQAEISALKDVDHYFAKIIGIESTTIDDSSKIALGALTSVKGGIRPFGVEKFDFVYGDQVVLKQGGGSGSNGNYGGIALGGTGACVLINNALYGYAGELAIGQYVSTEPGNMASMIRYLSSYINSIPETFDNFSVGSQRLWTLPIMASMDVNGRAEVEIVDFGQFFVEDIYKSSGKAVIKGRFVQYVSQGDIDFDKTSTGALGMKLVE